MSCNNHTQWKIVALQLSMHQASTTFNLRETLSKSHPNWHITERNENLLSEVSSWTMKFEIFTTIQLQFYLKSSYKFQKTGSLQINLYII